MSNQYGLFWNSSGGDRTYDADSFEEWLRPFFQSGVFSGGLAVTCSGSDMIATVAAGTAYLDGKLRTFDTETALTVAAASSAYPRIDTVVVERNNTDREISIKLVQGKYSGSSPVATAPVRTGGVYQLVLAQIYVGAGVTKITVSDITDTRPDSSLCGYVAATIENPNFSDWYAQNQAQFSEWFGRVKDQLSTDAAGNLQNEIDNTIRVEKITIRAGGTWTAETVNGSSLYTYSVAITDIYVDVPTVSLAASGSNIIPTAEEQTAYALVQYVTVDSDTKKLKLYCTAKPASDFVIGVKGVKI